MPRGAGPVACYLCLLFSLHTNRDVIDKTGVAGLFDIHLDLSFADLARSGGRDAVPLPSNPPTDASDPGNTLTAALRKLGLKLEPAKMAVDFLVIDHLERPSEN